MDLPILRWAKAQGAVVGFAHSGWGLRGRSDTTIPERRAAAVRRHRRQRIHRRRDARRGRLHLDGGHARAWELNIWYHTLNAGFRTRISGETDFPCIYGERVGLGRATSSSTRSTTTRGRGHPRRAQLRLRRPEPPDRLPGRRRLVGTRGSEVRLDAPGHGARLGAGGRAARGEAEATTGARAGPKSRIRRQAAKFARAADREAVLAPRARTDAARRARCRSRSSSTARRSRRRRSSPTARCGKSTFDVPLDRSSWVALRILPSSHTNPVFVARRRQAGPRVAGQRRVVPAGRRPMLVPEGAEDLRARAARGRARV